MKTQTSKFCRLPRAGATVSVDGNQAFTLIELLVTVAIIIVLVAVLLPIFNTVIDSGRKADSTAKLRGISVAMLAYLQDNNRVFFNRNNLATMPSSLYAMYPNGSWDGAIAQDIANTPDCFHSKRDVRRTITAAGVNTYQRSFTLNPAIINLSGQQGQYGATQPGDTGLNSNLVTKPSSFALIFECFNPTMVNSVGRDGGQSQGGPGAPLDINGFLVVCMDGHVDYIVPPTPWATYAGVFCTQYFTVNGK